MKQQKAFPIPTKRKIPRPPFPPVLLKRRKITAPPPIIIPVNSSSGPATASSSPIEEFSKTIIPQPTVLDSGAAPGGGSSLLFDIRSKIANYGRKKTTKEPEKGKGKARRDKVVNLHPEEEPGRATANRLRADETSIIYVDSEDDSPPRALASTSAIKLPSRKVVTRPPKSVIQAAPSKTTRKKATKPPPDPKKPSRQTLNMPYVEYVEQQIKEWSENPLPKEKTHAQCLSDLRVFYHTTETQGVNESTQIRINFVSRDEI
jgi:hypothetical protein